MRQISRKSRRRLVGAMVPLWTVLAGCCSTCGLFHMDKCADIPAGAIPQPTGSYACQWQTAHMQAAEADDFVIYENEWYLGGAELGPAGQKHVEQMSQDLSTSQAQVLVESAFNTQQNAVDETLNNARREAIVAALAGHGVVDADARVTVGRPRAEGLYGEEAARIGERRTSGQRLGGGGGVTGGLGTGGFGGSGIFGGGFGGGYGGGFQ